MIAVRVVNPAEAVWLRKCGVDSRSLKHFRCALDDDPGHAVDLPPVRACGGANEYGR